MIPVLLLFAGCQPSDQRQFAGSVRRELERGHTHEHSWTASADTSAEAVVALGYVERLQLGLGSPFRLIDYALSDPRLPDSTRAHVAWALLARVIEGDAYVIDAGALDRIGTFGIRAWPGVGKWHRQQIERTVVDAKHPRAGEEAVRMAYGIAAAEQQVSSEAQLLAGRTAALVHDRIVARSDALELLDVASRTHQDALALLRQWRRERRFAVEQPRLIGLSAEQEKAAVESALDLVDALHGVSGRVVAGQLVNDSDFEPGPTLLTPRAARLLLESAEGLDLPPQTPVFVAARQLAREAATLPFLSGEEKRARERFSTVAYSEERYVAERALLERTSPHDAVIARADLFVAVSLRSYAQEEVWYPAMGGPGPRALQERFGLSGVTFDRTVPAHWRPYYRRMLARSLEDVLRVMPALNLRGLSIHFGSTSSGTQALAMHEPTPRRLVLPPTTAAGTIAHEVAHDIDWQVALRRYHVRGDYATDRATRSRKGVIASHMRDLRTASLLPANGPAPTAHDQRPAEIFARGVDWYVAVALAHDGRVNGYLSSVQDELLTGYGTVRAPDVTGSAGDALMAVLDELAPIYREQRDAFKRAYGSGRSLRAYDLVRQVLEAPEIAGQSTTSPANRLARVEFARDAALGSIDRWRCSSPLIPLDPQLEEARRKITMAAVAARARGAALRDAELKFGRDGKGWMIRKIYQGPWPTPVQVALEEELAPLWEEVKAVAESQQAQDKAGFQLLTDRCFSGFRDIGI